MSLTQLNRMIALGILEFKEKAILLNGRLGAILPVEVLIFMHDDMAKKFGPEYANEIMFKAGRFHTSTSSVRYLKNLDNLKKV